MWVIVDVSADYRGLSVRCPGRYSSSHTGHSTHGHTAIVLEINLPLPLRVHRSQFESTPLKVPPLVDFILGYIIVTYTFSVLEITSRYEHPGVNSIAVSVFADIFIELTTRSK